MITFISIRDYQGIESIEFECGPITVITGESDTGKSSIVRAIHAAAFNSYPKGHVRAGTSSPMSEVVIHFDHNKKLIVTKGEKVNAYELWDGGEVITWDRVGTEVPEAVTDALEFRQLTLDDGTHFTPNIQRQFDPPFLLTESPSKVAKVIGTLTNISILYGAVKVANTWERRSNERIEAQHEVAARAAEQITPLAARVLLDQDAYDLLMIDVQLAQKLSVRASTLSGALMRMMAAQEQYQLAQGILKMTAEALPDLSRADELVPRLQGLTAMLTNAEAAEADLLNARTILAARDLAMSKKEARLELWLERNDVCPLCGREGWAGRHDEH